MRKIVLTAFVTILMTNCVWANNGDITGYIYATDIQTDFYGRKINSYNIGGQTVILCEDLGYFGFDVIWNAENRTLEIDDKYSNPQAADHIRDISLYILPEGYYSNKMPDGIYETDIKTFLNGKEIKGYNVGGQTAIVCESLRDYGYNVDWDAQSRRLSVNGNGEFKKTAADIGEVIVTGRLNSEIAKSTKKISILLENGECIDGLFAADYNTHYVSLTDFLKVSNTKWSFDDGKTIIISSDAENIQLSDNPWLYETEGTKEKSVDKIYLKILCGDKNIDIVYQRGGSLLTNGEVYESNADAYVYDSVVYIPWYTAMKIIDCE